MLAAFLTFTYQILHRCSQRKRREQKNEEIAASEGGLSQNVGQTTFAYKACTDLRN